MLYRLVRGVLYVFLRRRRSPPFLRSQPALSFYFPALLPCFTSLLHFPASLPCFTSLLHFPASIPDWLGGGSWFRWRSFRPAPTRPYCAAFSRSRMAPQERHTATPCLIFSAQTGHSASGLGS